MKRIYNKVYHAAMAALMLTAATACTSDNAPLQNDDTPKTTPLTTVTATQQGAGTQTRTGHKENSDGTIGVTWANNDKIYIGLKFEGSPSGSIPTITGNGLPDTYKTYTIASGQNSKSATFTPDNGAFEVPSGTQYIYALYGETSKIQQRSDGYALYDITGQRQKQNNDMTHIAEYDFMYAKAEYREGQMPNFEFHHVAALLKFDLTLPASGITVKELKLKKEGAGSSISLNTKGTYNFNTSSSDTSADAITLKLGEDDNGFTCNDNKLTAYMMAFVLGSNNNDLILTVTDTNGNTYSKNIGKRTPSTGSTKPGKLYTITATLENTTTN